MNRGLKCLAALAMSLALVAAPCRNCEPKPAETHAQQCQHDCCPKPKPEKTTCKWQPADYAAVEAKQEMHSAPQMDSDPLAVSLPLAPGTNEPIRTPQAQAEPPPLYLAFLQLRN